MTTETMPANYREWTTVDKSGWGEGPWQAEPDKVQWIDPATGLDCLLHRGPGGHWCGYVGVPEGHAAFGKDYDDLDVHVHGGLTFANPCADTGDESTGVCHVAAEGRPEHVWWLGFDCAHLNDFSPAYAAVERNRGMAPSPWGAAETYKDRAYVERQIRDLAEQLGR